MATNKNKDLGTGIFAAKERKERIDKTLDGFFFVIFVLFCGQFSFGCGLPGWPFAPFGGSEIDSHERLTRPQ